MAGVQPRGPDLFDESVVAAFDLRLAEIATRRFKVLLMFYWGPAWATGTDAMNGRRRDPRKFANAAAWAVARWGEEIDALEAGNEPDTDRFWRSRPTRTAVPDFAELVLATSAAVHAIDPDLPLVAGGTSRIDVGWWRRLLGTEGMPDALDAVGVHPLHRTVGPGTASSGQRQAVARPAPGRTHAPSSPVPATGMEHGVRLVVICQRLRHRLTAPSREGVRPAPAVRGRVLVHGHRPLDRG